MGKPAARIGDMHVCPMVTPGTPPVPHVGGPLMGPGVPTVLIGGMPAAVLGDMCTCMGPPANIVLGSMGVFFGKKPAARMGDMTAHGGSITMGLPTVLIGESCAGGGPSGGGSSGGGGGSSSGSNSSGANNSSTVDSSSSHDSAAIDEKMAALSAQTRAALDKTSLSAGEKQRLKSEVCTLTGHPVNVADGSVMTSVTDFELPGPIPLVWKRSWFSNALYSGPLGHGWFHPYDMAIEIQEDLNAIVLRLDEGILAVFDIPLEEESFFNRKEKMTLFNDGEFFYFKDQQGYTYRFYREAAGKQFAWVHKLQSIESREGFSLKFFYTNNNTGALSSIIDSAGREIIFHTDQFGSILFIEVPSPWNEKEKYTIQSYNYDASSNLVSATDALGNSFRYVYQGHLLSKETNRIGLSFYFEYEGKDEQAKCFRTYGDGSIYDHKLKYFTGYTEVTNSLGNTTVYQHQKGLVQRTTDPLGGVRWTMYNEFNELTVEIDETELPTIYGYDERGNQVLVLFADGTQITRAFNTANQLTELTDQNGGVWKYSYDEATSLLTMQENPLGEKTSYEYSSGLLSVLEDALGNRSILSYDRQYNLVSLSTPTGVTSTWKYDLLGRCTEVIDVKGNKKSIVYDLAGRATFIEEPDGNTRTLTYDGEGNILLARDKDYEVGFEYAGMNRMKARTQHGARVEFRYNREEQLTAIVNEAALAYRFELNEKGEVTSESGFDGLKKSYTRDVAGRVVKVTRPEGKEIAYTHDRMGRVTEIAYADGSKENFAYREDGSLIEATNQHLTVKLERDVLGRVVKEIQGEVEVCSTYDTLGNRIQVSSSLGAQFSYLRNVMGDVEEVSGSEADLQVKFIRDQFGLETARAFKGGLTSTWSRDRLGRAERQETFAGGSLQRSRTYNWETNSRLSGIADSKTGTTSFGHDAWGNLAWAKKDNQDPLLRMPDAVGNLFRTAGQKDRKYGPAGQLLQSGSTIYKYDSEGNLVEKQEGSGKVWKYSWNEAGMLKSVQRPEGTTVSFTYDALGRRLSKTYLGEATKWVWDGNTPLHEWKEKKQQEREQQQEEKNLTTWLFEPESFAPLAKVKDGKSYGIITDHLGTPLSMHESSGQNVWAATLNCYGEVEELLGKREDCPFRYPGQYEDSETGLYYNRFRYYAPEEGMYISQDPIGLEGNNPTLYGYVKDPFKEVDYLGLSGCDHEKIRKEISAVLKSYESKIKALDPSAKIGFRGSAATGKKGSHKNNSPFDPNDFDVDGFIVSDVLYNSKYFQSNDWWRGGSEIPDLIGIQGSIHKIFRNKFIGYRSNKRFNFRIFGGSKLNSLSNEGSVVL